MKMIAAVFLFSATTFGAASAWAAAKEPMPDFATAIPAADIAAGKTASVRCLSCHDMSRDKINQFGPPLWNIVNRPRATAPAFPYSDAMKASHAPWTYDLLFQYLKDPQAMVHGTPMSFAGYRNAKQRINVIAYLRTLSDDPAPLPAPLPSKAGKKPAKK